MLLFRNVCCHLCCCIRMCTSVRFIVVSYRVILGFLTDISFTKMALLVATLDDRIVFSWNQVRKITRINEWVWIIIFPEMPFFVIGLCVCVCVCRKHTIARHFYTSTWWPINYLNKQRITQIFTWLLYFEWKGFTCSLIPLHPCHLAVTFTWFQSTKDYCLCVGLFLHRPNHAQEHICHISFVKPVKCIKIHDHDDIFFNIKNHFCVCYISNFTKIINENTKQKNQTPKKEITQTR